MPITVQNLISLLSKLPPETKIFTAGLEGIFEAQLGNLLPLKVLETWEEVRLFIDDGVGHHGEISDNWEPLDEFVRIESWELQ